MQTLCGNEIRKIPSEMKLIIKDEVKASQYIVLSSGRNSLSWESRAEMSLDVREKAKSL